MNYYYYHNNLLNDLTVELRDGEAVELEVVVLVAEAALVIESVEGRGVVTCQGVRVHSGSLGEGLQGLAQLSDGAVSGVGGQPAVAVEEIGNRKCLVSDRGGGRGEGRRCWKVAVRNRKYFVNDREGGGGGRKRGRGE
jgi:hypothetical protein